MGERKGVNKYYPPNYDPNKGGLNKFLGTHALRERARKLHLGILIIRFEMPYNIWCEGCEQHIGMGVRYNAEKKKVGMYYSTPIYQFRMKCHLCNNHFEIKTDPANLDYVIVSGARRQEKRWDPSENEQVITEDKGVSRKMSVDAMYRLEHGIADIDKSKEVKNTIVKLEDLQSSRWKDDYAANGALREKMRAKRKEVQHIQAKDKLLNLNIPLLPPSEDDDKMAALLQFSQIATSCEMKTDNKYIFDMQSEFSKMKPVKYPHNFKRDFAMKSVKEIVSGIQRNAISSSCSTSGASSSSSRTIKKCLGIKKKTIEQVKNSHSRHKCDFETGCIKTGLIVAYDSSHSDTSD